MAMRYALVLIAILIVGAGPAGAAWEAAADIQPRVEHHIREVGALIAHFETFVTEKCPRFETTAEWNAFAQGEIDRMLLLAAHAEQAWVEAKRTGDEDIRRAAKAPRRRLNEARGLVDKLQTCAADNGASFGPMQVWRRIERDVPRRQAEIALPGGRTVSE